MQFTIVGNPENRRVTSFCEAVQRLGYKAPTIISYAEWLTNDVYPVLPKGSLLKIDSPGENETVRSRLIVRGLAAGEVTHLPPMNNGEFGAIGHMRAWYAGYCHWLDEISHAIRDQHPMWVMNTPADIRLQFNKPLCQAWLQQHHIPVPFRLPPFTGYDDLVEKMQQHRLTKVFIKPAHASSASGVIAFRKMGHRVQAITSVEMVQGPEGIKLYNSLTIRTYTKESEIAAMINRLMQENILAEEWLPKATLHDRFFDIRVLVIEGKARHTVIRTSRNTITNLHLGNKRGDLQEFVVRYGEEKLTAVKQLAERAAACFPASLYMGVDILLTADLSKTFVLEINAFGDLLPGLVDDGETCYEAQVRAMIRQQQQKIVC